MPNFFDVPSAKPASRSPLTAAKCVAIFFVARRMFPRATGAIMSPHQMSQRTIDRIDSIGPQAAAKITDTLECRVEREFREQILAIPRGSRITKGWMDTCNWVTMARSIPFDDDERESGGDDEVHLHLTVLCMAILRELCKGGFLVRNPPEWAEREFVRTDKMAPGPRRRKLWN